MRALLLVLVLAGAALASAFSDGWCEGYKEGWCYGKTYCIKPICPIAPIPNIGENSWQDGYNRGFLKGLADRD